MIIALALLLILLGVPIALGVIALVPSFVWPHRWEIIAVFVSMPIVVTLLVGMAVTYVTEERSGGDAGPLIAVQMIFAAPFVAWYFGFIAGGAFAGRWLGEALRRRRRPQPGSALAS